MFTRKNRRHEHPDPHNRDFHIFLKWHAQFHRRHHQEFQMMHAQLHRCHHQEFQELRELFYRQHEKRFRRYHRYFHYLHPAVLLFNLIILYLLFRWVGIKGVGIIFVTLIGLKEILQHIFWRRLEKRIFQPIEQLRQGVDEIAKGNYNVQVECTVPNDLGLLILSFNEMAQKLSAGEKVQAEYEENRKTLIANISHDLKTPITAIQGYIEALLEGTANATENRDKYLKTIYNNTIYINNLINDLFLFSQLDLQKLEFKFEKVLIRNFMSDLMEEYRFDLEEKHIHFQYTDRLENDYHVNLDRKRFYQAFNNLINNAVKHGSNHNLSIQVKLYLLEDFIGIDIEDNGPGIAEGKLPHIFDRFYRVDTERTKDLESTGLGLAITKELIEAHGGKISVASLKNQGTCFTIMLPVSPNNKGDDYQ